MSKCNDLMSSLVCKSIWKKDAYISQHFCTLSAKQLKKYLHHKTRKKAEQSIVKNAIQIIKCYHAIMLIIANKWTQKYKMHIQVKRTGSARLRQDAGT